MAIKSLAKSDRFYCMKECQTIKSCQFSSYSEAKNQCLLFNTCYKLNKNESLFSSSRVSCDLPPGGTYVFVSIYLWADKVFVWIRSLSQKQSQLLSDHFPKKAMAYLPTHVKALIKIYHFSTVDCQLGPWTSCDSCCGSVGKTRFFGRMPKVEHTGDKCSQGDTWQKCENLPSCAGI